MIDPDWLKSGVWLMITMAVYVIALMVNNLVKAKTLLHPLIVSVVLLALCVTLFSISVVEYQQHVWILHWLLGPATVALAVPLRNQVGIIRQSGTRFLIPIVVGGISAPAIALAMLMFSDLEQPILRSLLTRSITTPLAMETAESIGGYSSLAAIFVVATGIIGVLISSMVFRMSNLSSDRSKGLVLGTLAHAIGTATAFRQSEKMGMYSTLALCINGLLTAISLIVLFSWLE